jgi:YetA-like protein
MTRRSLLRRTTASTLAALALEAQEATPVAPNSAQLRWLGRAAPGIDTGVSFGVPWPRGAVSQTQTFALTTSDGAALPLQSWPLAYWPDGSIKWNGFATVAHAAGDFRLALGPPAEPATPIKLTDAADAIEIDTGKIRARIPKQGAALLDSIMIDNRAVAGPARLVCTLEGGSTFTSSIRKLTVEQRGPVRANLKIEGVHKSDSGTREWLPFVVRLYFYAGLEPIRLIHTIVYDGDEKKEFIRGLGLSFAVPMREQIHNRHVRFSGADEGLWAEPVQPATGRRALNLPGTRTNAFGDQLAGKRLPNREAFDAAGQKLLHDWAVWNDYRLIQASADGFSIQKRVNAESCWLDAAAGRRASGMVFAGDASGGLGVALRNFWQSHPTSLEVRGATTDHAEVRVWLWSPDAPAMDLRHYDLVNGIEHAHDLDSSYEDVQTGFSTPHGVARTSELMLYPSGSVPPRDETARQAELAQAPPLLTATPDHIHSTRVFGIWSLPDRSTPAKRAIEDRLDAAFALYHKEVEQRHWYGFWNYGDVMHQHDGPRHMWRYDIGGFAWDNSELGTDMWLWYSFLRSGRADIFRMAEAMTRHTGEVDVYHAGRFAGLGSRHNVRHWGCGAKEARISQAAYRRFLYYLTTDERVGDLMHEVADADFKTVDFDPMRLASPLEGKNPYPTRVRGGPDWLAFVGNWMTEWERTGNTKYRDKIITGMDSIAGMPYGFLTGPNQLYGYDPATGKLYPMTPDGFGRYNLTVIMGGAEVVFELNELIDHPGWKKAWLQYCRLTTAQKDVVARDMSSGTEGADARFADPGRLSAYVYAQTKEPAFAARAWTGVTSGPNARQNFNTVMLKGPDVLTPIDEVTGISTNSTAQGCLTAIEVLAMCGDRMPE